MVYVDSLRGEVDGMLFSTLSCYQLFPIQQECLNVSIATKGLGWKLAHPSNALLAKEPKEKKSAMRFPALSIEIIIEGY